MITRHASKSLFADIMARKQLRTTQSPMTMFETLIAKNQRISQLKIALADAISEVNSLEEELRDHNRKCWYLLDGQSS